jgi:AcrR family transcriptional regulator
VNRSSLSGSPTVVAHLERLFQIGPMLNCMTASTPAPDRAAQGRGPALRADARRNRDRIVDAARRVFAEQGLDASMNEVARRAGVGVATLFRRFPTRDELVAAAFADRMSAYTALVEVALDDPDPCHGFCEFVQRVCSMQAGDRGFTDLMTQSFPTAREFEAEREQAYRRFGELIDRAKEAGRLRPDFSPEDLPLLLMANAGVVTATASEAPQASPRLVAYLLQAFADGNRGPLPPPPTSRQMYRALLRFRAPRRRARSGEADQWPSA